MKKIFALIAIASLMVVACGKQDDPKKPDNNNNEEGNEYVAPITIDGDFADWAALDASKIQTAVCAEETTKTDLKLMKVYADAMFIYVYVEFNLSDYDPSDIGSTHFDFYINGDNDKLTGGWNGSWDQGDTPCIDMFTQGEIFDADGNVVDYAPGMHRYAGAPNTSEWAWEDVSVEGFITGKGNKSAFEFSMCRELYPLGTIADTFTMGADILVNGWDATGALPNAEITDDTPSGQSDLLTVITNK